MSAVEFLAPSETDFSPLSKPDKSHASVARIGRGSILVKPRLAGPGDSQETAPPLSVLSSSTIGPRKKIEAPKVRSTLTGRPQEFKKIRKYEGVIFKRQESSFWVKLREAPEQYPTLEAEFGISELDPSDRDLAVEGTPVIWTLGFGRIHGTWIRESIIYIRRLLPPAPEEYEKSEVAVRGMMNAIRWE